MPCRYMKRKDELKTILPSRIATGASGSGGAKAAEEIKSTRTSSNKCKNKCKVADQLDPLPANWVKVSERIRAAYKRVLLNTACKKLLFAKASCKDFSV